MYTVKPRFVAPLDYLDFGSFFTSFDRARKQGFTGSYQKTDSASTETK